MAVLTHPSTISPQPIYNTGIKTTQRRRKSPLFTSSDVHSTQNDLCSKFVNTKQIKTINRLERRETQLLSCPPCSYKFVCTWNPLRLTKDVKTSPPPSLPPPDFSREATLSLAYEEYTNCPAHPTNPSYPLHPKSLLTIDKRLALVQLREAHKQDNGLWRGSASRADKVNTLCRHDCFQTIFLIASNRLRHDEPDKKSDFR